MPLTLNGDGRHVIRYFSKDNVGNVEDTQALVVVVDTTSPKIIETFSRTATKINESQKVRIPKMTSLFLAAQDNAAGVTEIWYSIDKKKDIKYLSPIVFENKGTYTIDIKCNDNIGNKTEKSITIEVAD
jgi:D-lyxose ketol-isomerase